MVIWVILLLMTAAAVAAVLWPLSRRDSAATPEDPDSRFYRDQIAEIERDRERGMLLPAEAEAARTEAGRRLLRASATTETSAYAVGEPALRRRRAVSAIALSLVPILAIAVYGAYGSPHIPVARPAPEAAAGDGSSFDLAAAVVQIEAHLAKDPSDGRGWDIIAPVYLRMGRVNDAVVAYESALRILGRDADRLTNYGEALVLSQNGVVSATAKGAFEEAVGLDGSLVRARYYLAQAAAQDGDTGKARAEYASLLASAPPNAPIAGVVREQLARLDGAAPRSEAPPNAEAILGMVQGLAARLEASGGTAEEWTRLIRSYVVLGQADKAKEAARRAREALAKDGKGLQMVEATARELRLTDGSAP